MTYQDRLCARAGRQMIHPDQMLAVLVDKVTANMSKEKKGKKS